MPQKIDEERLGALLTSLACVHLLELTSAMSAECEAKRRKATVTGWQPWSKRPHHHNGSSVINGCRAHVVTNAPLTTLFPKPSRSRRVDQAVIAKLPLAMKACKPLLYSSHVELCKAASLKHSGCETCGGLHRSMKLLCRRRPRVHSTVSCWRTRQEKPLRLLPVVREPNKFFSGECEVAVMTLVHTISVFIEGVCAKF